MVVFSWGVFLATPMRDDVPLGAFGDSSHLMGVARNDPYEILG